jgi:arylsulfatase A-like enzyme
VSPTVAYLFGVESPRAFDGRSLLPLESYPAKGVFGEAVDKHGSEEKGEEKEVHYYLERNLKIIYHERDESWELYDLKEDPKESRNIVTSSPEAEALKNKIRPRVRRYERQ